MKRIIFIMLLFMFAIDVKAASATLSVDKNDVNVGDNLKINVSITDAAAWNIHVNVDGIDDCSFSFVDVTNDAKNTNTTLNKKCKIILPACALFIIYSYLIHIHFTNR